MVIGNTIWFLMSKKGQRALSFSHFYVFCATNNLFFLINMKKPRMGVDSFQNKLQNFGNYNKVFCDWQIVHRLSCLSVLFSYQRFSPVNCELTKCSQCKPTCTHAKSSFHCQDCLQTNTEMYTKHLATIIIASCLNKHKLQYWQIISFLTWRESQYLCIFVKNIILSCLKLSETIILLVARLFYLHGTCKHFHRIIRIASEVSCQGTVRVAHSPLDVIAWMWNDYFFRFFLI